jgi:hypothetical protein
MPRFDLHLRRRVSDATAVARAGEVLRSSLSTEPLIRHQLYPARLETLYEIALLRIFVEWEVMLENTFIRYLCGYRSRFGQFAPVNGPYQPTVASAERVVYGTNAYLLWHNPVKIVARSKRFLVTAPHEMVIASNSARLAYVAAIRHRVAHGSADAKRQFDFATTQLAGRRYRGSRPGRFLRDWDSSAAPVKRWLDSIGDEICNLAAQIV